MNIKNAINNFAPTLESYMLRCADNIVSDAKTKVPVRTGRLRDSIKSKKSSERFKYIIEAKEDYGLYVEVGTSRMLAQPYLKPALLNRANYSR